MKFKKIKRWIRTSSLANSPFYQFLRFKIHEKACDKAISVYIPDCSKRKKDEVKKMMKEAVLKYHWDFYEFFYFDYQNLSEDERLSFVPEYEKNVFCSKVNDPEDAQIFYNKWETYCKFKKFYNREAVYISSISDLLKIDVVEFVRKHTSFILKPVEAACGRGIKLIKELDSEMAMNKLKQVLSEAPSKYIMEELICQVNEMASFHESSVNTIRITTINYGDHIDIIHPFMRTGQGGSFVDNGGSGGIIAAISPDNGKVIAACDESLNWYELHPNSKLPLVGFKVPYWEAAISTARALATMLPNVKYVGWDLALTEKGWVMVEGNDFGAFVGFQLPTRKGFRLEFEKIKKQLYNNI